MIRRITGESEWTPWIAIATLILIYAVVGVLMFAIIDGMAQLVATATL